MSIRCWLVYFENWTEPSSLILSFCEFYAAIIKTFQKSFSANLGLLVPGPVIWVHITNISWSIRKMQGLVSSRICLLLYCLWRTVYACIQPADYCQNCFVWSLTSWLTRLLYNLISIDIVTPTWHRIIVLWQYLQQQCSLWADKYMNGSEWLGLTISLE